MIKSNRPKSRIEYWHQIPWKRAEKVVFSLQKRIYQASLRDDVKVVRRLQKLLLRSFFAKAIAVRRAGMGASIQSYQCWPQIDPINKAPIPAQDNQGKKTAGIDGVKSLTPKQRLELINSLVPLTGKSDPVRRVWIPKPGKDEKRPLGIPTMEDRARQCLAKLALEPEWEARFEPNSYGFRPGRSCHDAIEAIFIALCQKTAYILDADIAKWFDRINHQYLLNKLNTFPAMRRQVKAWLKAGILEGKKLFPSENGTPQGGVISPLLANIALHGLETHIKEWVKGKRIKGATGRRLGGVNKARSISVIRYADDFVIIHKDLEIIKEAKEVTQEWLKQVGLEIKPEKTRFCHSLNRLENEKPGFNFLGFNVRQYPTGKHHANKTSNREIKPYTLHIKPSKEAIDRHYRCLADIVDKHKAAPQKALIAKLNSVIRGWSNYYRYSVASEIFSKIDHLLHYKLIKWADKRHPNKTWKFKKPKYWRTKGSNNWLFSDGTIELIKHKQNYDETEKVTKKGHKKQPPKYVKVKDVKSPFDGETIYWSSRLGKNPNIPTGKSKLLKYQKGKCSYCGLYFKEEDIMETDHIIPSKAGGNNSYKNLQLLHRHCHDKKTATDLKLIAQYQQQKELTKRMKTMFNKFDKQFLQGQWVWVDDIPVWIGTNDNSHASEERYEVKVSRTVLKTSGSGD